MELKLTREQLYLGVAIILLIIVIYAFTRGAFKTSREKLKIKEGDGGVTTTDDGEIDIAVYKHKAEAIHTALYGWNFSDEGMETAYNIIMPLTNNELRLLVNSYDELFGNDDYAPTLRALLSQEYLACSEWYYLWYESPACKQRREIYNKLDAIGA